MQQENAETVALQALGWLANHEDLLPVFFGATGADINDVRENAGNADFLASVLDFVMMDDAWVAAFCDTVGLAYTAPLAARQALPGGQLPNWT